MLSGGGSTDHGLHRRNDTSARLDGDVALLESVLNARRAAIRQVEAMPVLAEVRARRPLDAEHHRSR
jgi:hypothetical protein